jgi:hypothetical protein
MQILELLSVSGNMLLSVDSLFHVVLIKVHSYFL